MIGSRSDDGGTDGDSRETGGDGTDGDAERRPDPDESANQGMEGVFGARQDARPIEPGHPTVEHAMFVLLGVLTGVAATLKLVGVV